jgi:putative phosphoesterase
MKIGLLSDTHGYLDPKVAEHFNVCDEIWHAGDIGSLELIDELKTFKPVEAVYGNIDDFTIRQQYPEDCWFMREGLLIWMTHIGGTPPRYNPRVNKILRERQPDIFVCGHSHILKIMKDAAHNNLLFINPGAAGRHGFHHIKTLVRFDLLDKKISNLEVIEIGKRASLDA